MLKTRTILTRLVRLDQEIITSSQGSGKGPQGEANRTGYIIVLILIQSVFMMTRLGPGNSSRYSCPKTKTEPAKMKL